MVQCDDTRTVNRTAALPHSSPGPRVVLLLDHLSFSTATVSMAFHSSTLTWTGRASSISTCPSTFTCPSSARIRWPLFGDSRSRDSCSGVRVYAAFLTCSRRTPINSVMIKPSSIEMTASINKSDARNSGVADGPMGVRIPLWERAKPGRIIRQACAAYGCNGRLD